MYERLVSNVGVGRWATLHHKINDCTYNTTNRKNDRRSFFLQHAENWQRKCDFQFLALDSLSLCKHINLVVNCIFAAGHIFFCLVYIYASVQIAREHLLVWRCHAKKKPSTTHTTKILCKSNNNKNNGNERACCSFKLNVCNKGINYNASLMIFSILHVYTYLLVLVTL